MKLIKHLRPLPVLFAAQRIRQPYSQETTNTDSLSDVYTADIQQQGLICYALRDKCNINLSNAVVFVPTHAASLYKAFLYNGIACKTYHCNYNEIVGIGKTQDCIFGGAYL